ncbi:hypothetical protein Y032_0119g803 [Ancylostoma ceylanicum]|nr:hypothetical protein Y032_0119g803 [Ancylostoma ceylanicum]
MKFAIIFIAVMQYVGALIVPSSFGCKNSLISDEWRKMVLEFHTKNRRIVTQGKQRTEGSKTMPVAKNMNELVCQRSGVRRAQSYSRGTPISIATLSYMLSFILYTYSDVEWQYIWRSLFDNLARQTNPVKCTAKQEAP